MTNGNSVDMKDEVAALAPFDPTKKKKKKKTTVESTDDSVDGLQLLGRVFNILRENNPELAGDRRRTAMTPPQVLREGPNKTVFENFMDVCESMHRQPDHVMAFCLGCKSPDTIPSRDNLLFFPRCDKCGSGRSVESIKAGFVARVGRRNARTRAF